jgi:DNA-directed RNA polymerase subunit M
MDKEDFVLKGKNRHVGFKKVEEAPSEEEIMEDTEYEEIACSKCGAKKALSWMQQTRASDEPPTRFYKCVSCGYTWREYS